MKSDVITSSSFLAPSAVHFSRLLSILCYLNVNNKLFRNVGPFVYSENCKYWRKVQTSLLSRKLIKKIDKLTFSPQTLQQTLTDENVSKKVLKNA